MHHQVVPCLLTVSEIANLKRTLIEVSHHDDGGHHILTKRPNRLMWLARRFHSYLGCEVDPNMKFYKLSAGKGAVKPHRDEDYSDGHNYTHSMLIHLNDDYVGGETLFDPNLAPKVNVGGALIFNHNVLHSGHEVISGTKLILKTDVAM